MRINVPEIEYRLFHMQQNQAAKRGAIFREHEMDEMVALRALGEKMFGKAGVKTPFPGWPGCEDVTHHYGGIMEMGPQEIGIIYMGWCLVDPYKVAAKMRRRQLILRGNTIAEFEEQGKLVGLL